MAVAVKFPLPSGIEPWGFLESGLKKLWILPHGLSALRYMLEAPSTLVVSFHSPKVVGIEVWQRRLTEAYGEAFGALVTEMAVKAALEETRDNMRRLAVHKYYCTEGNALVDDVQRNEAKHKRSRRSDARDSERPTKHVALGAVVVDSSRVERVGVCDEAGELHQVAMRQSQIELLPVPAPQKAADPLQPPGSTGAPNPEGVKPAPKQSLNPQPGVEPAQEPVDIYAQGDYTREIAKFMKNQQPWRPPPGNVAPLMPNGDVSKYLSVINTQPLGTSCINRLVPSVLKSRDAFSCVEDDEHRRILGKINAFFRTHNWEYMWSLCPFNDMQYPVYSATQRNRSIGRSYLELARRALRLEGEIARIVAKLYEVVGVIPSMIVIPDVAQGIARLLLERNCGRLCGGGEDRFFLLEPRGDEVTRKLREGTDQGTLKMLDFLARGREAAFGSGYIVESPLAWLLPTIAFLFEHRELLAGVANKDNAKRLRELLEAEWEKRRDVYWLAMTPLVKYGAFLTRCV